MAHTPTPWTIDRIVSDYKHITNTPDSFEIEGVSGSVRIAVVDAEEPDTEEPDSYGWPDESTAEANAEFIVRAVNNHDRLVEALEAVETELLTDVFHLSDQTRDQIRAALAAARGEE